MRYSRLDASKCALQPGGVCPTLPSFVKMPRSLASGAAKATPKAITNKIAHATANAPFCRISSFLPSFEAPAEMLKDPGILYHLSRELSQRSLAGEKMQEAGKSSNSDSDGNRRRAFGGALVGVEVLIGGGKHRFRL